MYKTAVLIFFFFSFQKIVSAQDTLPKITVTQLGKNVLVSWNNPFTNVTAINIQRSGDSLKNFKTIGSVLNLNQGVNGFTDPKEFIPSLQYYRVFISFEGGNYLFTESHRPGIDTLTVMPPIDNTIANENPQHTLNLFVPSKHVYTGKDNNVIISLPDAERKNYSIKFYEENGRFLFELKKVPGKYLMLDKVNFRHSGLFSFEIFANQIIVERNKFFIPKDGKPMPPLDRQGNEIRPN
jgi:hypothetical protein